MEFVVISPYVVTSPGDDVLLPLGNIGGRTWFHICAYIAMPSKMPIEFCCEKEERLTRNNMKEIARDLDLIFFIL